MPKKRPPPSALTSVFYYSIMAQNYEITFFGIFRFIYVFFYCKFRKFEELK